MSAYWQEMSANKLPNFNKIVSNMPYSILQQFFMRLIKERKQNFEQAVMIVPYGFAKKMTATPRL